MNKSLCLLFFALMSSVLVAVEPQKTDDAPKTPPKPGAKPVEDPIKKRVKADVDVMNSALMKGELEKVIDLTHPKAIELAGGRKEMLSLLKKGVEDMKSKGIGVESTKAEDPDDPVSSGTELFIVARHTMVMKIPGGKMHVKGYVVGVSSDKGKSWKYVNGGASPEALKAVIPNLPDALKLPEATKPVIEKD